VQSTILQCTNIYFSVYVIVISPEDGRHKQPEPLVEDRWMTVLKVFYAYKKANNGQGLDDTRIETKNLRDGMHTELPEHRT